MLALDCRVIAGVLAACAVVGCGDGDVAPAPIDPLASYDVVVVTFNTGTSEGMGHDAPPDDGYGSEQAAISDTYYGDGLAWLPVIDDAKRYFARVHADVVVFQEIFYAGDCPSIPPDAQAGWICETWQSGDPTVAQLVLGDGWQVACNLGKTDKCAAVRRSFGSFRGCDSDLCLDGLAGAEVMGCGSGSRIGRGVIDMASGQTLTLVNVHGTSGLEQPDQDCRAKQFNQVFVDLGLGDGEPAANGEINLVMGDFNTDPGRTYDFDESAQVVREYAGEGKPFHFISDVGPGASPSYAGLFNIDHVISDRLGGECVIAGVSEGQPAVSDVVYFDHKPVACGISGL